MRTKKILFVAFANLLMGTVSGMAQDPPGASQQERNIREDANRPTVVPPRREREIIVVPAPVERGTVGQGRRGPLADDPPGSEFQDMGNNEDAGSPPEGDRRR